jgi:hypothetical protein
MQVGKPHPHAVRRDSGQRCYQRHEGRNNDWRQLFNDALALSVTGWLAGGLDGGAAIGLS